MNHDNKPLTLEEIRNMGGEPVWIENIKHPSKSQFAIIKYVDIKIDVVFQDAFDEFSLLVSMYGKTWLAYAQKPIGFDKWTAEWKEYTGADAGFHYCSKCGQQAFNYEDAGEIIEVLSDFCPSCGKAMTDYAREMLERRLTGHNNEQ